MSEDRTPFNASAALSEDGFNLLSSSIEHAEILVLVFSHTSRISVNFYS